MNRFDKYFFQKYVKASGRLVAVCHRHVVEIIDTILLVMFFAVLLPSFFYAQNSFGLREIPFQYFELYLGAWYIFLLYRIFDWYNDAWLITDRAVIDVNWNIYTRNVAYVDYESIRGVTVRTNSFIDPILWKGDIVIEMEWDDEDEFVLFGAENPGKIVELIQIRVDQTHEHDTDEEEIVDDREPFEILVATLSDMVKEHIDRKGILKESDDPETEALIRKALRRKSTIDLTKKDEEDWFE